MDDSRCDYIDVRREVVEGIVYGLSIYGYEVVGFEARRMGDDTIHVSLTVKTPYRIK